MAVLQAIDVRLVDQPGPSLWISAGLPVLGVMLGAALAGGVRLWLDRRSERAQFRAVLWVLLDDLSRMQNVLKEGAGPGAGLGTARSPLDADAGLMPWLRSEAWNADRKTLALGLRSDPHAWNELRWCMSLCDDLRRLTPPGERSIMRAEDVIRWGRSQDELRTRVDELIPVLAEYDQAPQMGRLRRVLHRGFSRRAGDPRIGERGHV